MYVVNDPRAAPISTTTMKKSMNAIAVEKTPNAMSAQMALKSGQRADH